MKTTDPQISEGMLKPLLEFSSIKKGTHIHRKNDQSEHHWQLTTFIIKGIDNAKEVLICKDMDDKSVVIPFTSLGAYYVNVHEDYKVNTKRKI